MFYWLWHLQSDEKCFTGFILVMTLRSFTNQDSSILHAFVFQPCALVFADSVNTSYFIGKLLLLFASMGFVDICCLSVDSSALCCRTVRPHYKREWQPLILYLSVSDMVHIFGQCCPGDRSNRSDVTRQSNDTSHLLAQGDKMRTIRRQVH